MTVGIENVVARSVPSLLDGLRAPQEGLATDQAR